MSSLQDTPVHLIQGGTSLHVDGSAGGSIDTPLSGGVIPIGITNAAGVQLGVVIGTPAAGQAIATSGTITLPTGTSNKLLTPASAATGVILTAGTIDGQELTLINNSSNSVTMAAAGTSNVADGTSCVIAADTAKRFVWSATATLWFHT